MAVLPGEQWLIQQIDGTVIIFNRDTEEELLRFDPHDTNGTAQAQGAIHQLDVLSEEDRAFAHFWSGYFYAWAQNLGKG